MTRILEIDYCDSCFHFKWTGTFHKCCKGQHPQYDSTLNLYHIPKTCPLPKASDQTKKKK